MTEESVQRAIRVLRSRMSGYWQGLEAAGRDEMVTILRDELGYDAGRARDLVDAMIASGQLRYNAGGESADETAVRRSTIGRTAQADLSSGEMAGTPIVRGPALGAGYWQIGREDMEEPDGQDVPGRKGQVNPPM